MANKNNQNLQSLVKTLRNNFPTFLLGLTVLLVIILVVSLFSGGGSKIESKKDRSWTDSIAKLFMGEPTPTPASSFTKAYTVKEGDNLWSIAEGNYGSGYNAYDIALANKLDNPDQIEVGQNLVIPDVASKTPTKGEMAGITTGKAVARPSSYTVQSGDSLWLIAEKYYGDGYVWVKIAEVNKFVNPDFIYAGAVLTLP